MRFAYKAKSTSGEIKEGFIEAENRRMVISRLQRQNLFPILVKEEEEAKGLSREISLRSLQRITRTDVCMFTRQMSDLLKSGLALAKALQVLEKQAENERLKRVIHELYEEVAGGASFSDALAAHPRVFGELYANMVRAGEVGGMLDAVMERLADFAEAEMETRSKVAQAMAYPAFLVLVGVSVIVLLLMFVLPKLSIMFEDFNQQLPIITEVMIGASKILRGYWWVMVLAIVGGVVGFRRFVATPQGRLGVDRLKLKLPLIGDVILKREIAKFARTLGTLLGNGVSILKSMEIVEHTLSNQVLADQIREVAADIREGERLSSRLEETGVFPPLVVNMVAVGEETGELEAALLRVATSYESSTDRAIKTATTMMEPLFIVIMAIMVGMIALSMILPILQLSSNLR